MLHGGDNDSTGCLAGAWYGALYGLNGVSKNNYDVIIFVFPQNLKSFKLCFLNFSLWNIKRDY